MITMAGGCPEPLLGAQTHGICCGIDAAAACTWVETSPLLWQSTETPQGWGHSAYQARGFELDSPLLNK